MIYNGIKFVRPFSYGPGSGRGPDPFVTAFGWGAFLLGAAPFAVASALTQPPRYDPLPRSHTTDPRPGED